MPKRAKTWWDKNKHAYYRECKNERTFRTILTNIGHRKCPDVLCHKMRDFFGLSENPSMKDALGYATYIHALKGEPWAIQFIADRTEGKPAISIEGLNSTPTAITIVEQIIKPEQVMKGQNAATISVQDQPALGTGEVHAKQ